MEIIRSIQNRIYEIRDERIIMDFDLGELYAATASKKSSLRSQFVILEGKGRHSKYLPYVFTEQGIAMLSGVLNSDKAIQMNIAIMRAFVAARRLSLQEMDLRTQLKEIKEVLGVHDSQLNEIYDAIEELLDEYATRKKWNARERIGFKK